MAKWYNALGYLPIDTQPSSAAFSINNSGEIVGGSDGIPFVRKVGVLETLLVVSPAGWGSLYGTEFE
jgi:hypothetical protein